MAEEMTMGKAFIHMVDKNGKMEIATLKLLNPKMLKSQQKLTIREWRKTDNQESNTRADIYDDEEPKGAIYEDTLLPSIDYDPNIKIKCEPEIDIDDTYSEHINQQEEAKWNLKQKSKPRLSGGRRKVRAKRMAKVKRSVLFTPNETNIKTISLNNTHIPPIVVSKNQHIIQKDTLSIGIDNEICNSSLNKSTNDSLNTTGKYEKDVANFSLSTESEKEDTTHYYLNENYDLERADEYEEIFNDDIIPLFPGQTATVNSEQLNTNCNKLKRSHDEIKKYITAYNAAKNNTNNDQKTECTVNRNAIRRNCSEENINGTVKQIQEDLVEKDVRTPTKKTNKSIAKVYHARSPTSNHSKQMKCDIYGMTILTKCDSSNEPKTHKLLHSKSKKISFWCTKCNEKYDAMDYLMIMQHTKNHIDEGGNEGKFRTVVLTEVSKKRVGRIKKHDVTKDNNHVQNDDVILVEQEPELIIIEDDPC